MTLLAKNGAIWVLYSYIVGPFLASLTTTDVSGRRAVWCLFSTYIIPFLLNSWLPNYIYVKS